MSQSSPQSPPFGLFERMVAGRYLRATRKSGGIVIVRLISFFGIALAVMTLIVVMSVMSGFRSTLLDNLLGTQGHIYAWVSLPEDDPQAVDRITANIETIPGVQTAIPHLSRPGFITSQATGEGAYVKGLPADDFRRQSFLMDNLGGSSQVEKFGEGKNGGNSVILGRSLALALQVRVGDMVNIMAPATTNSPMGSLPRRKAYEVVGTVSHGVETYDRTLIYMPLEQAQIFFKTGQNEIEVEIRVDDPLKATDYRPLIRDAVGAPVGLDDWVDRNSAMKTALDVERSMMRLILLVLVAITAMTIVAGLVMLVKNKGRDIAILRTMGASGSSILRIFLMVGSAIGFAGTLFGLVLGVLFCIYIGPIQRALEFITGTSLLDPTVYELPSLPAKLDPTEIMIVVAWGFFMSLVATFFPALHASRLDPVEALRNE